MSRPPVALAIAALLCFIPLASAQTPLTDEDCTALAGEIQESIEAGDPQVLNQTLDLEALMEKSMAGVEAPANVRAGFKSGLSSNFDLGQAVCTALQGGAGYSFLRVRRIDNSVRLLFRLLTPEGALNYHEHVLVRSPAGKLRIIDSYVYVTAEMLSQSFRRGWIPIAAEANKGAIEKLLGNESEYVKHVEDIARMGTLAQKGEHSAVLEVYSKLPESLKREKNVLLMRLTSAAQVEGKPYEEAIEDFRKFHPKDPALDLILIDGHLMAKKHAEAEADIDRLDKNIGGDPYLDVMRASIWIDGGNLDKAREFAKRATEKDPSFLQAWYVRVGVAVARRDHADTAELLTKITEEFGVEWKDLSEVPDYADFVKSPEYVEWKKQQGGE